MASKATAGSAARAVLSYRFYTYLIPGGVWREEPEEFIVCKSNWLFKKTSLAEAFRNRFIKDCIPVEVFTKRFIQHILPPGFKKIRFYGWMSNAKRKVMLSLIRRKLNALPPEPPVDETAAQAMLRRSGFDITCCPNCKDGTLVKTTIILPQKPQGP